MRQYSNGEIMGEKKLTEPLIAQLGGTTALRVPQAFKQEHPAWKSQNPTASMIELEDKVQLVFEWSMKDGKIESEENSKN
jgi:hypothetical protein